VAAVAHELIDRDRISRLALVGFSMGGNLVLKLAGEWGRKAPPQVRAVAGVCPSMDLAASADALHEKSNRLYEYYFLLKLRQRLREKARFFPGHFDPSRAKGVKSLREFDDKVTAPYCGFSGAADYYQRAAASQVIDQIAVPTLILHATNDPFIRVTAETRAKMAANTHITFHECADGGHCSFLADANGYDGRWAEREIIDYLCKCP
jgi:hypothetical protein